MNEKHYVADRILKFRNFQLRTVAGSPLLRVDVWEPNGWVYMDMVSPNYTRYDVAESLRRYEDGKRAKTLQAERLRQIYDNQSKSNDA